MPSRFSGSVITVAMAPAGAVLSPPITSMRAQAPTASGQALKTPWGEPDLQGIWTDEFDTPLQRQERSALLGRRATERNLAGGYNFALFLTTKRTGARTSRIVDPADGRIPPLTAEAQQAAAADREFRLALLQATDTCKNKSVRCSSGTYDPMPSPRQAEPPPRYNATNFGRLNRHDGPEDGALADRCLTGVPEFGTAFGGSFRRIVQTPGGVSGYTRATTSWIRRLSGLARLVSGSTSPKRNSPKQWLNWPGKAKPLVREPFKETGASAIPWGTHELVGENGRGDRRGKPRSSWIRRTEKCLH
jgi:hypothetical protein